jgi:hypothetical protein
LLDRLRPLQTGGALKGIPVVILKEHRGGALGKRSLYGTTYPIRRSSTQRVVAAKPDDIISDGLAFRGAYPIP